MNNYFKNQKGSSIMFMTLVVTASCMIIVLISSDLINNGLQMNKNQNNSTKAYFAAEAGAERILWEIRKNGKDVSSCNDNYMFCFDGSDLYDNCIINTGTCAITSTQTLDNDSEYSLGYMDNDTDNKHEITATGEFGSEVKRTVEVSYEY